MSDLTEEQKALIERYAELRWPGNAGMAAWFRQFSPDADPGQLVGLIEEHAVDIVHRPESGLVIAKVVVPEHSREWPNGKTLAFRAAALATAVMEAVIAKLEVEAHTKEQLEMDCEAERAALLPDYEDGIDDE